MPSFGLYPTGTGFSLFEKYRQIGILILAFLDNAIGRRRDGGANLCWSLLTDKYGITRSGIK